MRRYRVHCVRKDGSHVIMGPHLMTHQEACTLKSKLLPQTKSHCILVEGEPHPCIDHDPENARGRGEGRYCLECLEEIAQAAATQIRQALHSTALSRHLQGVQFGTGQEDPQ